jgi:hypothetical protein
MMKPTLGRVVWYRGKLGFQAMRMAHVVCTVNELMPEGVKLGVIQALDSDMHVHLQVMTPGTQIAFPENNVPFGVPGEYGMIPPGSWCWPVIK